MVNHIVILLTTFAILVSAIPAEAQQSSKLHRIGYLSAGSAQAFKPWVDSFRQGLRELSFLDSPVHREALFWEHESNRAVRVGEWKLVSQSLEGPWELYNLSADRTESTDLSGAHPDRVQQLASMWQAWAERANVLPLDNRRWLERLRNQRP